MSPEFKIFLMESGSDLLVTGLAILLVYLVTMILKI